LEDEKIVVVGWLVGKFILVLFRIWFLGGFLVVFWWGLGGVLVGSWWGCGGKEKARDLIPWLLLGKGTTPFRFLKTNLASCNHENYEHPHAIEYNMNTYRLSSCLVSRAIIARDAGGVKGFVWMVCCWLWVGVLLALGWGVISGRG
jgi:hypothetical protein